MGIKIGNIDASYFKVGGDDCSIYLGTVKLYPQEAPVADKYLTFVANGNTKFKLSGNSVSYSLDSGTTWASLASDTYSPTVASGNTIMWKMTSPTINTSNGIGRFYTSGGTFDVEGNIMSLLYGDNFEGQTALQGDNQFRGLFDSNTSVINASGMTLPATAMTASCYRSMFGNCTNLESAPTELPATSLADSCYYYMFSRTSITSAPTLSATTLVDSCYGSMFSNCLSLSAVTCLATTNISGNVGAMLFNISTNGTFERASGVNWPCSADIPPTWTMIPAYTPLYRWKKAPATEYECVGYDKHYVEYYQVSNNNGCSYINVTPTSSRTSSDVIEYYSPDCGYVPTKQYFTITSLAANNTITLRNNRRTSSASSFRYSTDNGTTWSSFSLSSGQTQTIATLASGDTILMYGTNTTLGSNYNAGHYFRGSADYEVSGEISSLVNGNATDTEIGSAATRSFTFAQLFSGDTHLVSAENLKISSTALPQSCFNGTFRSCTRLVKAPELPSTILGKEAYSSMFEGCIGLAYPPSQLYFTSVQSDSFNRMFCMSRSSKITTPAMTYTPKMFGNWGSVNPATSNMQMFCGNGNLTNIYCYWTNNSGTFGNIADWVNYTADSGVTFTKRSTQSFASGVNGIKTGWTVVNDDTTQPT